MSEFLKVSKIEVRRTDIEMVYQHLQDFGKDGFEGVALWAGFVEEDKFIVTTTIIPQQKSSQSEDGLLYTVDGEELHRINVWLYKNKLSLMLQIHSHPQEAYHSDTDDRYPIVSQFGGLSIVVPNFGFDKFSLESWAVYRLLPSKEWKEISLSEKESLFKIL